jgi:hypothetical protein
VEAANYKLARLVGNSRERFQRGQCAIQSAQMCARTQIIPKNNTLKVSEKGGVSLYGMGRFPVTLYKEQLLRNSLEYCRHK